MNIIILSCLNLDLLDLPRFTGQFKPSIPAIPQTPINYYLIDHLVQDRQPIKIQSDGTSITRIDINKFIEKETENELIITQPKHENTKNTTHKLYKEYLAYLIRATAPSRKLIENIFYHNPEYIDFIKYYLFSIIKLVGLVDNGGKIRTEIWSCDPIFHWLLESLRTYYPLAVDTFYNQFQQQGANKQLIICGPPMGWPIAYPPGIGITRLSKTTFAKFTIPYLEQQHEVIPPPILGEFRSADDIYNLDLLNDYIVSGNQQVCQGEIKGVLGLDDITTGLTQIFQDQIINRQLRIPRHCLKTQDRGFEILIQRQQIPHIREIHVLADIAQQLEPGLLERHQELIARELSGLHAELDNLSLEWELRIQKFIKLPIKIRFADP